MTNMSPDCTCDSFYLHAYHCHSATCPMLDKSAVVPLDKTEDTSTLVPVEEATNTQGGMTVREAANALGVSCQVIYLLNKQNKIRLIQTDHGKIVPLDVLDTLRERLENPEAWGGMRAPAVMGRVRNRLGLSDPKAGA